MLEIIYCIIVIAAIVIAGVNEYYSHKLKVVPMASLPWVGDQIINAISKHSDNCRVIYELGSGWGGLAYKIAKHNPKSQVKGFELSPIPFLFSALFRQRKNITFKRSDILKHNYADADIIVFYLMPHLIDRLYPIIEKTAPKGTVIIASGFPITDATPIDVIDMKNGLEKAIYVYKTA